MELKIRKFGNSLGVVLPKEVINRLNSAEGDALYLVEDADGTYRLTPYNPDFAEKMRRADDIVARYKNTLHALSK
jgi:putative addiction module antidote